MKIECSKIETPKNFVKAWLDYSKAHDDESFFSFMCLFMAFNHLYSKFQYRESFNKPATSAIRDCVSSMLKRIWEQQPDFDLSVDYGLLNDPVFDGDARYPEDADTATESEVVVRLLEKLSRGHCQSPQIVKAQVVMLRIYQIRCNLFHGGKYPTFFRNVRLVHDSAVVMKKLLGTYIQLGFGDDPRDWRNGI